MKKEKKEKLENQSYLNRRNPISYNTIPMIIITVGIIKWKFLPPPQLSLTIISPHHSNCYEYGFASYHS